MNKTKTVSFEKVIEYMKRIQASGYAVAVFTPEELGDINPEWIEDHMVECGNDYIEYTKEG